MAFRSGGWTACGRLAAGSPYRQPNLGWTDGRLRGPLRSPNMLTERNLIPTSSGLVAASLAAGSGALALNRAEDLGELALCFVSLPAEVPDWIELVPGGAMVGADGRAFVNDKPQDFVAQSAKLKRIQAG